MGNHEEHLPTEIYESQQYVWNTGYMWVQEAAPAEYEKLEQNLQLTEEDDCFVVEPLENASNEAYKKNFYQSGMIKRQWLIAESNFPLPRTYRRYNPLQESALFITFANLKPQPEEILEFANQYGLLGEEKRIYGTRFSQGETLGFWEGQIQAMKKAWDLWNRTEQEDMEGLARHIHWFKDSDGRDGVAYTAQLLGKEVAAAVSKVGFKRAADKFSAEIIASAFYQSHRLEMMHPGDVIVPAKYYVQKVINKHLEKRVSPKILWDVRRQPVKLRLFHMPESLIGALWLQFAQAVHGDKKFYYCDQCGSAFELDPRIGAKRGRKFCSNACRSKALRNRQIEARRLSQEGMKPAEIAKRLDSKIATVKKWITASKKKQGG